MKHQRRLVPTTSDTSGIDQFLSRGWEVESITPVSGEEDVAGKKIIALVLLKIPLTVSAHASPTVPRSPK